MECLNNSVSIKRIQLGTAYQSQMEALALEALEIESTVGEGYEFDEYGMPPEEGVKATYNISISRTMALTRARYMANYSWSLREINKRPHSQIRLPAYIRNGTVGKTVKGIPYCWGGFNGYESEGTNEAKLSFNTAKIINVQATLHLHMGLLVNQPALIAQAMYQVRTISATSREHIISEIH